MALKLLMADPITTLSPSTHVIVVPTGNHLSIYLYYIIKQRGLSHSSLNSLCLWHVNSVFIFPFLFTFIFFFIYLFFSFPTSYMYSSGIFPSLPPLYLLKTFPPSLSLRCLPLVERDAMQSSISRDPSLLP